MIIDMIKCKCGYEGQAMGVCPHCKGNYIDEFDDYTDEELDEYIARDGNIPIRKPKPPKGRFIYC